MFTSSYSQFKYWKTYIKRNRFSYDQIPDQTGKVVIVTGANIGLGYATTVALAGHGAHVFLACRDQERATNAIERAKRDIKEKYPHAASPKLEFLELDLNDMSKARQAAKDFLAKNLPLHLLICNSGILMVPFELSADGIETQFAVNHMGHFVFTTTLLDRLRATEPSRVVIVSSIAHEAARSGGIDFETLNVRTKGSNAFFRYARSKLANVLFAKALARRLEQDRVYVNVAHPGYVHTGLLRHTRAAWGVAFNSIMETITKIIALKPEAGCLTQLYLAISPDIEEHDIRGRYFIPIGNEIKPSAYARDEILQEKLWLFSEKLVREKIGEI
ncbi:hypothetical protein BGZ99_007004 [Dissophora globulifera]|uniref:NAD(P)-binding protein n=1 Tax=Dissophora globulifera TaxID=979702 RepID=A0A9P6URM2_9FUNG|nr:hypothetical protein BGZ99_007004 [Dissophora globulifera]